MPRFTTQQICDEVGGTLLGPPGIEIEGIEQIDVAQAGQLTFIADQRHAVRWGNSKASAALVTSGIDIEPAPGPGRALIYVADADLAMAQVLWRYAPPSPQYPAGVAAGARVDTTTTLAADVAVGPGCYVGPRVHIGGGTILHPNVTVFDDARIGHNCVIWSGSVVRERCQIGDRTTLHPNVSIGADGFGYRPSADGNQIVKIPQIGAVRIGDDVEIGAGSCIDRGKFSDTRIGDQTKIDNQCQIGHNCHIGSRCLIAGQTGIAGSVTIADGVLIGGKVAIKDHVKIGSKATIAGGAAVMNNVPAGETWAGYPARPANIAVREQAAIRKLPDLVKMMKCR